MQGRLDAMYAMIQPEEGKGCAETVRDMRAYLQKLLDLRQRFNSEIVLRQRAIESRQHDISQKLRTELRLQRETLE